VQEMERLMRLHDDVMRVLTIKVDAHTDGPSVQMQKRDDRERGDREGGFGDRGDRPDRGFAPRGDRPDRAPRR
jgi:small subunit ribosomal protein S6